MDYQAHYDRLICRARGRVLVDYKERHHVVPRCMGGVDHPSNLVDLTAEEHYVAHQLLIRIYPNIKKLATAASMMARRCTGNKAYGWLRRRVSEAKRGNKHNLGRVVSAETRAKIGAAHLGNKHNAGKRLSAETRAKISAALAGKKKSPSHVEKLRAARAAKNPATPPVEKSPRVPPQLGKPRTPEERLKISLAMKGRKKSPETRARMSEAQRGNKHALGLVRGPRSAEHIQKLVESRRRNRAIRSAA